jgi:hypothetical protein
MPATRHKDKCLWCGASLCDGERLPGRMRCSDCGVATTDPWPLEAELDGAYAGAYRPASGRFYGFGDALLRRTRGSLARRLNEVAPAGAILDVGAGNGALLDALHLLGREAVGIERECTRPDVMVGDLADPAGALERSAALLVRGGVLAVAVPNSASLQAFVFGDRWFALDLPRHLFHLTSGALVERLRRLGLRDERVSYLRGGQVLFGWLDGLVGLLPGHPSLYDAIRRPEARFHPLRRRRRFATLLAAILLVPVAVVATGVEVLLRRGGTVYIEAVAR